MNFAIWTSSESSTHLMRSGIAAHCQSILSVLLPLLLLLVLLPEDMMNKKCVRRKEDGLTDTEGRTYIFAN